MKTILSLDLGTHTGWAYRNASGIVEAGCWTLLTLTEITKAAKLRKDRTLDMRVPVLYRKLETFWDLHKGPGDGRLSETTSPIDFLVFEDVQFSSTTMQTQLWSSLRAAVWLFCFRFSVPRDCCPVSTLKKFSTGSGHSPKPVMIEAAKKLFPEISIGFDDNISDALCLLKWASERVDLTKGRSACKV